MQRLEQQAHDVIYISRNKDVYPLFKVHHWVEGIYFQYFRQFYYVNFTSLTIFLYSSAPECLSILLYISREIIGTPPVSVL